MLWLNTPDTFPLVRMFIDIYAALDGDDLRRLEAPPEARLKTQSPGSSGMRTPLTVPVVEPAGWPPTSKKSVL